MHGPSRSANLQSVATVRAGVPVRETEAQRVAIPGSPAHIDISVGDPDASIPFYAAFFADPDGFKIEVAYLPSAQP